MCCIGPGGSVCQHNHGSQTKNKLCRAKSFSNISSQNISKTYPLIYQHLSPLAFISTKVIALRAMRLFNKTTHTTQTWKSMKNPITSVQASTIHEQVPFSNPALQFTYSFLPDYASICTSVFVPACNHPFLALFLPLFPAPFPPPFPSHPAHTQQKKHPDRMRMNGLSIFIDYWKV